MLRGKSYDFVDSENKGWEKEIYNLIYIKMKDWFYKNELHIECYLLQEII